MSTDEPSALRLALARAVGIGLALLAFVALYAAIFYAWIDDVAPGHAPLNHAMAYICALAVPASLVGAIVLPRLIRRKRP